MNKYLLFFAAMITGAVCLPAVSFGEIPAEELMFMEIDSVLNQPLAITKEGLNVRETPNIVTVVTRAEIENSGARDLIDILRFVPGIVVEGDNVGTVSIGMRGNWAQEGKVLLLLDGHMMNELFYGNLQLGNHIPIEEIQKIEIIRGPGSALYGGFAEMGVINITTRKGSEINGVSSNFTYGQFAGGVARRNFTASFGKASGDLEMTGNVFIGEAQRSEEDYRSYFGKVQFNMRDNNVIRPFMVNCSAKYKGLNIRVLLDQYRTMERDWWGPALENRARGDFDNYEVGADYEYKISEQAKLWAEVKTRNGTSYQRRGGTTENVRTEDSDPTSFNIYTATSDKRFDQVYGRDTADLGLNWNISDHVNMIAGSEFFRETAEYMLTNKKPQYENAAAYAQTLVKSPVGQFTAGARYENHSQFGSSFVPRFGYGKVWDPFHIKLLHAYAFRVPTIEDLNLNPDVKPERSQTTEAEVGYKISCRSMLTVNLFRISMERTLLYYSTPDSEAYINGQNSGTMGAEVEYKYVNESLGFVNINYSYSKAMNDEPYYQVPQTDAVMLAMPQHKITLNSQVLLTKKWIINPSVIFYSERYGYYLINHPVEKYNPVTLLNLFVTFNVTPSLKIGAGVNDILDQKPSFITAYNGQHAPLPGPSRELVLKLTYHFEM